MYSKKLISSPESIDYYKILLNIDKYLIIKIIKKIIINKILLISYINGIDTFANIYFSFELKKNIKGRIKNIIRQVHRSTKKKKR